MSMIVHWYSHILRVCSCYSDNHTLNHFWNNIVFLCVSTHVHWIVVVVLVAVFVSSRRHIRHRRYQAPVLPHCCWAKTFPFIFDVSLSCTILCQVVPSQNAVSHLLTAWVTSLQTASVPVVSRWGLARSICSSWWSDDLDSSDVFHQQPCLYSDLIYCVIRLRIFSHPDDRISHTSPHLCYCCSRFGCCLPSICLLCFFLNMSVCRS